MKNLKYCLILSLSCLTSANAAELFQYQEDVYEHNREVEYNNFLLNQLSNEKPSKVFINIIKDTENVEDGTNE